MAGKRTSTPRRYAEAAFEIARRDGNVDVWLAQLDRAAAALADESVVRRLENPQVPLDMRHAALTQALGADLMPKLSNLIGLVLRRRRLDSLPEIAREYRRLYNRMAGITEATATSAAPLAQPEVDALRQRVEKMTGGKVELRLNVDPALLGGVQIRVGDQLIDGSVRGRLERLRSRLAAGSVAP